MVYTCDICFKQLHNKSNLNRHKSNIHANKEEEDELHSTEEEKSCKLSKCEICKFSHNNNRGLKRHMRNTHNIYARERKSKTVVRMVESIDESKKPILSLSTDTTDIEPPKLDASFNASKLNTEDDKERDEQHIEHTIHLEPIDKEGVIEELMRENKRYLEFGKIVYDLLEKGEITRCGLKREHKRALDIFLEKKEREELKKYSIVSTHYGNDDDEWNSDDNKLDCD